MNWRPCDHAAIPASSRGTGRPVRWRSWPCAPAPVPHHAPTAAFVGHRVRVAGERGRKGTTRGISPPTPAYPRLRRQRRPGRGTCLSAWWKLSHHACLPLRLAWLALPLAFSSPLPRSAARSPGPGQPSGLCPGDDVVLGAGRCPSRSQALPCHVAQRHEGRPVAVPSRPVVSNHPAASRAARFSARFALCHAAMRARTSGRR